MQRRPSDATHGRRQENRAGWPGFFMRRVGYGPEPPAGAVFRRTGWGSHRTTARLELRPLIGR